jgi:hypothetical protein
MFGRDKTRMSQWLLLSLLAYCIASTLSMVPDEGGSGIWPRAQTVLWKVGHLNLAAYLGYWIDRNAFRDRIDRMTPYLGHMRRAIIMAATMIAFGMAL